MTSSRPYLIRALYEWITDNGLTPHILVNTQLPGVEVPLQHVHDGRIVLNIGSAAVQGLQLGNDWIVCSARFGGATRQLRIPTAAVLIIYARENGQGMAFGDEDGEPPPQPDKKPTLKVVK
ncbi:MAG: ClpXP protease specificity-enhancing factor [Pseudomonadota bacterium]|nr:ClpXP protease specificity-enhancing factor [Pseudomonadota bacterium]